MTGVDMELCDLWVAEFGTEAPSFGGDTIWKFSAELGALRWAESVVWAERINGRPLLPGQLRKLQRLHGFDGFPSDRRGAVLRRAGNGGGDTGRDELAHREGNWSRVNGTRPGMNRHNLDLAKAARLNRIRMLRYCAKASATASENGGDFDLKRVFAAGSRAIFGRPQPYACRSKVKGLRDWIEAEMALENVTDPRGFALNDTPGAMVYVSSETKGDLQNLTHRPGTVDNGNEISDTVGAAEVNSALADAAEPVCLRGCRRDQEPGEALQLLVKAARQRLVGIAKSALPTLREAHKAHPRIPWGDEASKGDRNAQKAWAHGWLTHWLRQGCDAHALVRIYLELLARHDEWAVKSGFKNGQFMPWGFRKRLQIRAAGLPVYPAEHFTGESRAFQPTPSQMQTKRDRIAAREMVRAAKPGKRVRRRSASAIARDMVALGLVAPEAKSDDFADREMCEVEVMISDSAAESAYADFVRKNNTGELKRARWAAQYKAASASGDFDECRRIRSWASADGVEL